MRPATSTKSASARRYSWPWAKRYQSRLSPAGRSRTQGQSESSNSGRLLSSTSTQPSREMRPGSSDVRPSTPSSVRVVPPRLAVSRSPGTHVRRSPARSNVTRRVLSENGPLPSRYSRSTASVLIFSRPCSRVAVKCGTGSRRFTKTSEASSSKRPTGDHSIRRRRGVSTVNRASPAITTAAGSATGFHRPAAKTVWWPPHNTPPARRARERDLISSPRTAPGARHPSRPSRP